MAGSTRLNAIVFSLVMLLVTLFVTTNLPEKFNVGVIYSIMATFAALMYIAIPKDTVGIEFGGKTDWKKDVLFGLLIGGIWAAAALFFQKTAFAAAFSLGVPSVFSLGGGFNLFVVLAFAPTIETFFKGAVLRLMSLFGLKQLFGIIITSIAFSLFHLYAFTQGDYAAVTSPFIAAIVFGIIAMLISIKRNNLLTAIVFHIVVNGFVTFISLSR